MAPPFPAQNSNDIIESVVNQHSNTSFLEWKTQCTVPHPKPNQWYPKKFVAQLCYLDWTGSVQHGYVSKCQSQQQFENFTSFWLEISVQVSIPMSECRVSDTGTWGKMKSSSNSGNTWICRVDTNNGLWNKRDQYIPKNA